MKRVMTVGAILFTLLTVVFALLCRKSGGVMLSLAITMGTFAYHFVMRLLVGGAVNAVFRNRMDASRPWFRVSAAEQKLYKKLRLSRWKGRLPTYDPAAFSLEQHTPEEILGATCQAEVVHELIMLLSFLPLLAAIPFGSFGVFLMTSLAAAVFDGLFVMLQRYNRPRLQRALPRLKRK